MFSFRIPTQEWGNCIDPGTTTATLRCLPILLQNIVNILVGGAGIVALLFFIWGSIKFITSQGDPQKLDAARKTIIYAVVGIVLVIFSFAILALLSNLTGVRQIPH